MPRRAPEFVRVVADYNDSKFMLPRVSALLEALDAAVALPELSRTHRAGLGMLADVLREKCPEVADAEN